MGDLSLSWKITIGKTVLSLLRKLQSITPLGVACSLENAFVRIYGSKVRHSYDAKTGLFCAEDGGSRRYFGDMGRGFDFYRKGLKARGRSLAQSYCLDKIKFDQGDLIIDCGSNYADLFLGIASQVSQENYITFEPGPTEHYCITRNVPNAKNFNRALSNSEGTMNFYLSTGTGDSSLIEPKEYTEIVKVRVSTLDTFVAEEGIDRCKLLKLEAEGGEPEILHGAQSFIRSCEYVAIDGGLERGIEGKATFHDLNNRLMKYGFEMVELNGPRYRALYRNRSIA